MSQSQKVLIKVIVTIFLLGFLAYQLDLSKLFKILLSANLFLLILASLIQVFSRLLWVMRWSSILGNFGIYTRWIALTKIMFIGLFFNLFLPSGIGGDFFRAYYLAKKENRRMSTTFTTTVLERSAGLCALLVIGTFFSTLQGIEFGGFPLLYGFLVLVVIYVLGMVIFLHPSSHRKISDLVKRQNLDGVEEKMEAIYEGLNHSVKNKPAILSAIALSFVIQFLGPVTVWISGMSIGVDAPFRLLLVFIPLITFASMIPLTINGIGVRESLFYLLFSQSGLSAEMAVSLSLASFFAYVLADLPGGIIYSLYKREEHMDKVF